MSINLPDYQQWKKSNADKEFSFFDYAHAILREKAAPADLVLGIASIVWPNFVQIGDGVYLAEQYSEAKVESLRAQGLARDQIEFWVNIFSVDGFFADLDSWTEAHEEDFSQILASAWRRKLELEFPQRKFVVQVLQDPDVGDLCVVFTQKTGT